MQEHAKLYLNRLNTDNTTKNIHAKIPTEEMLNDLSDLFKVLGDLTRIKIIYVLLKKEMSVNEIAEYINMTQSATSHQLNVLIRSRLVKSK